MAIITKLVSSIFLCGRHRRPRLSAQSAALRPTIDIYTNLATNPPSSRNAVLSLDPTSEINLMSRPLLRGVLDLEIQPLQKEGGSRVSTSVIVDGKQIALEGYVDIRWSIKNKPRKIYNTRFFVPDMEKPPFDAILGKDSVLEYALP
jgi:hypothetical protein